MCYECQRTHLHKKHWSLQYWGPTNTDPIQAVTAQTCSAYCELTSEKQALAHSDRKRNCGSLRCLPRTRDSGAWRRTDSSCEMIHHYTVADTVINNNTGLWCICIFGLMCVYYRVAICPISQPDNSKTVLLENKIRKKFLAAKLEIVLKLSF